MPIVQFQGEKIKANRGEKLREILLRAGKSPHNGKSKWLNCKGFGTCGTCAVEVIGEQKELNHKEKWRLNFPPHQESKTGKNVRLACQFRVDHDIEVKKHPGFWGQHLSDE